MHMLPKPTIALSHGAAAMGPAAAPSVLLFLFAWLAATLPLWPHRVPTLWLWGALSGVVLVTSAALLSRLNRGTNAIGSLLGCSALIGIAGLCDFLLMPPEIMLAQCRPPAQTELLLRLWRHIASHGQWFPVTNGAMLLWIFLRAHAHAGPERAMFAEFLPHLASCLSMVCCMGIAMTALDVLGASVQEELSADGVICAMLTGMCLHHLAAGLCQRLLGARHHPSH